MANADHPMAFRLKQDGYDLVLLRIKVYFVLGLVETIIAAICLNQSKWIISRCRLLYVLIINLL